MTTTTYRAGAFLEAASRLDVTVLASIQADPIDVARALPFPCVLKPLSLSGSRAVIRADDPDAFAAAFRRVAAILRQPDVTARAGGLSQHVLIEGFIPGQEVALEGLLSNGRLKVLALFDKPDPLDGPFFEEMIPIPQAGILREVRGQAAAGSVPGIEEIRLTIPVGQELVPLPEGTRYLGFIFARDDTPERVEASLREAHRRLTVVVTPTDGAPTSGQALSSAGVHEPATGKVQSARPRRGLLAGGSRRS